MTGPVLLSLLVLWATGSHYHGALAQPLARDCANCGLGTGVNQCGATDEDGLGYEGVFAARGPSRPRITADLSLIAELNAKRQRIQPSTKSEVTVATGAGVSAPKTGCRQHQGSVVYVGDKPLTRPAPLPSRVRSGPREAEVAAARAAELERLLNLPPDTQIVPRFETRGDLCYPTEQVRATEVVQNPQLVVTGVQPARVPKLPCGCDKIVSLPSQPQLSEFDLAVAKETERRLAQIRDGKSTLGFQSQQPASAQPGFTPLSQSFVTVGEFDNPDEESELTFAEQEDILNQNQVLDHIPADVVSMSIYYKRLASMLSKPKTKTQVSASNVALIDEDVPFFGPKSEPKDGRTQPKTIENVPEEKMFNIPGPIFELGPLTAPEPQEPEPEAAQPLVTYSDIGFKPAAPTGNTFKTVPSKPASFSSGPSPSVALATPGMRQGPVDDDDADDEVPCGPMGAPLPDYEPGKVLVTTRDQVEPDCDAGAVVPYRQGYNRNRQSGVRRKSSKAIKDGKFRTYAYSKTSAEDSTEEVEMGQDSNESMDTVRDVSSEYEDYDEVQVDSEEESPEVNLVHRRKLKERDGRNSARPRLTVGRGCSCSE